jgi:protein ImuB
MFACIHGPGAAASGCAYEFSPRIEELDPNTVVADAAGLDRLFGHPAALAATLSSRFAELGFTGSIAIAANPDAAVHAARGLPGVTVIPRGEEAARLADLPIDLLDPTPEIQETLACWGIRTFRDLAALPEIGIAERLGAEGVRLQKLARGAATRPLRPVVPELIFEQSEELEYPVTELEPLSFILNSLLHQLCAALESRALAAIEIHLTLKLENQPDHARALRLPVPMRDTKILLKLLQLELSAHPPAAPILAVTLRAEAAKPRAAQTGLYTPPAPEPEKLELTLARIAAVVGRGNVGIPELVDTHRPGAFRLAAFQLATFQPATFQPATWRGHSCLRRRDSSRRSVDAQTNPPLRIYRPALPANIQAPEGRPAQISAHGIQGRVLTLAGPWRISGDWWTPTPWARDEWDIALSDGALYRIYYERPAGRWFIEGSYD